MALKDDFLHLKHSFQEIFETLDFAMDRDLPDLPEVAWAVDVLKALRLCAEEGFDSIERMAAEIADQTMTCQVPDCYQAGSKRYRGYCPTHYQQVRKYGEIRTREEVPDAVMRIMEAFRKEHPVDTEPIQWHLHTSEFDVCPRCGRPELRYVSRYERLCLECIQRFVLEGKLNRWKRRVQRSAGKPRKRPRVKASIPTCSFPGCWYDHEADGFCMDHYNMKRAGRPLVPVDGMRPVCAAPKCPRSAKAKGYCNKHYQQIYRHGRLVPEREQNRYKPAEFKGYCTLRNEIGHLNHSFQEIFEILDFAMARELSGLREIAWVVDVLKTLRLCAEEGFESADRMSAEIVDQTMLCQAPDCCKAGSRKYRGYCRAHYEQLRKHGETRTREKVPDEVTYVTEAFRQELPIDSEPIQWHLQTSMLDECPRCDLPELIYVSPKERLCLECGNRFVLKEKLERWKGRVQRNAGKPGKRPRSKEPIPTCSFPGCWYDQEADGYCTDHYNMKRAGRPLVPVGRRYGMRSVCKAPECTRSAKAKGYCSKHYQQIYHHGRLVPEREKGGKEICKVFGCSKEAKFKGYCDRHGKQQLYLRKKGLR